MHEIYRDRKKKKKKIYNVIAKTTSYKFSMESMANGKHDIQIKRGNAYRREQAVHCLRGWKRLRLEKDRLLVRQQVHLL